MLTHHPTHPMRSSLSLVFALLALLSTATALRPTPAEAQVTAADSAAVILRIARDFDAADRWDIAEPLYRLVVDRYGTTTAAVDARARLEVPPESVTYGDGTAELTVWATLYGASLGVAIPGAFGASSSEPYGLGLLLGGPTGFLTGRSVARSLDLTEGQARAITLGGTWGAWQGIGWQAVLDVGIEEYCEPQFGICYQEDSNEEAFAAAILGSVAGVAVGALFSDRDITPGTATAVNFGSLWGTWFGLAGGVLLDLDDSDDLLAATLVGGDAALLATALLAPGWNVSRGRARMVSIAGVLGGLAGAGVDLLAQPDDEKVAIAIPLVGSVTGLILGAVSTRDSGVPRALEAAADGSLLRVDDGRLSVGLPLPMPTLVPADREGGWRAALGFELFRATF